MNEHTYAVTMAILDGDDLIASEDEGDLAYLLRSYFTKPISKGERRWIRRNVPKGVNYNRVNWAEVARNVQLVAA